MDITTNQILGLLIIALIPAILAFRLGNELAK
uniref:Photosystem I reaction center subunit XII n=1 Tax=Lepocinclis spirogyroides TaxID=298306 RepID=Q0R3K9_9EUGL|nr:photosystem I protein M [Lepocinclis spirogyroides]